MERTLSQFEEALRAAILRWLSAEHPEARTLQKKADILKVSYSTVAPFLQGKKGLNAGTAARLMDAIGKDWQNFLGDGKQRETRPPSAIEIERDLTLIGRATGQDLSAVMDAKAADKLFVNTLLDEARLQAPGGTSLLTIATSYDNSILEGVAVLKPVPGHKAPIQDGSLYAFCRDTPEERITQFARLHNDPAARQGRRSWIIISSPFAHDIIEARSRKELFILGIVMFIVRRA